MAGWLMSSTRGGRLWRSVAAGADVSVETPMTAVELIAAGGLPAYPREARIGRG
jgi:hypothetical protein